MKNTSRKNRSIKVILGAVAAAVMMTAMTVFIASADSGNINNAPAAPEQTEVQVSAEPASCGVPAGSYTDANGTIAALDIKDNGNGTANCEVNVGNVFGVSYVYAFTAEVNGTGLTYSEGAVNAVSYDAEGRITGTETVSKGHSGSITANSTGLVWQDSDGTGFVFAG